MCLEKDESNNVFFCEIKEMKMKLLELEVVKEV